MKKTGLLFATLLAVNAPLWADEGRDMGRADSDKGGKHASAPRETHSAPKHEKAQEPAKSSQNFHPVHIDLSHPGSGTRDRNFDTASKPGEQHTPAYGQVRWTTRKAPAVETNAVQTRDYRAQQQNIRSFAPAGTQAAGAVHHHPYTQGYVRKKLQKIGVKKAPEYITDRAQIINTDRNHSIIRLPQTGPGGDRLVAVTVSDRHYSDPLVKTQMARVTQASFGDLVAHYNRSEMAHNRYYWHVDHGFNYCHYVDDWGYHWYGWYVGDRCFWTRHYAGRWWWYDGEFNRWCFWNAGFWWWQDPAHVGDLYCYDNAGYIPCNSAEDQIVVTLNAPAGSSQQVYTSPDGTRQVKVMGDSKDAFLYDTAQPASFAPIYLASEVSNVQFSRNAGRPLEIVLSLGDGTFDLFDDEGNPYGPGTQGPGMN